MKRSIWVAVCAIAIAILAATYYYRRDVEAEAPAFTTAAVSRGDVISTVDATGTLEAVTTVQVGSQVSGTISALHADFNSEVRKGQIIAELDASLFETQVEQAKATVVRLQADADRAKVQAADAALKLKRARELFDKQLIPATDLETAESTSRAADAAVKGAEAQVVQAQASLNQAQVNLSHTIIRAPIDGVVIARNVDVGQTVASSLQAPTLFVIARDLTEMRVNASIDESDIGEITPKQSVRFRVDAYPNDTFTGTVSQVRLQPVVQLLGRTLHASSQLPVRICILLLVGLVVLASQFGLDLILGAFAAGMVVRLASEGNKGEVLREKLEAIGFGFLVPLFFVLSGIKFDLAALLESSDALLRVPFFLALFLLIRGAPSLLIYRNTLEKHERLPFVLYISTALPLIVAITDIGVQTGRMRSDNAAALVGAGMASVLLLPLIALTLRKRAGDARPGHGRGDEEDAM